MRLRIGYRSYTVIPMTPEDSGENGAVGRCSFSRGIIKVAPVVNTGDVPPDEMADTLVHEVLHAIWQERGLSDEKDDEEVIVTNLAHGIIALIRDNPGFMPAVTAMAVEGHVPPFLRAGAPKRA